MKGTVHNRPQIQCYTSYKPMSEIDLQKYAVFAEYILKVQYSYPHMMILLLYDAFRNFSLHLYLMFRGLGEDRLLIF